MTITRWFYNHNGERIEVTVDMETGIPGKVHIKAVDGAPFKASSELRHHRGQTFDSATMLYVDVALLEVEPNPVGFEVGPHGELRSCQTNKDFWKIDVGLNKIAVCMRNWDELELETTVVPKTKELEQAVMLAHNLRWGNEKDAKKMRHITNELDSYLF